MDGLLRLFFSVQLCSFSQKCPPKTKPNQRFDFFFNILMSKQVEYISALCNLKNDYKKRLQPCEKKISIDWQRRQSVVVMGVLPPGDVALYYYW